MRPWQQKALADELVSEHSLSFTRACSLSGLSRSKYYYQSCKDDSEVITALQKLATAHTAYGFRKLLSCLRRKGKAWNHKAVYRVYKLLKLK